MATNRAYRPQQVSLEDKKVKVQFNGALKEVPAFHVNWCEKNKLFTKYIRHPVKKTQEFDLGEKDSWLHHARYVETDLKWFLNLEHHKFWSQLSYSIEAQCVLSSFLQEAPPYYLPSIFPQDEDVLNMVKSLEKLVFLVYLRLCTERETPTHFISERSFGNIIYNNYIFTIPIIFDLCLVYGYRNRDTVSKMIQRIFEVQPNYYNDLQEAMPCILKVFSVVAEKFYPNRNKNLNHDKKIKEISDIIIYFYDSMATIEIFLDILPQACDCFIKNNLPSIVSNFYNNTLPNIYNLLKQYSKQLDPNIKDLIELARLSLLSIFKNLISYLLNEAVLNKIDRIVLVDELLNLLTETMFNYLFMNDYNNLYNIVSEIEVIPEVCHGVDQVKLDFVLNGIKSYLEEPRKRISSDNNSLNNTVDSGIDVESLVIQVQDVLPDVPYQLIKEYLKYFQYNTQDVISAVLENNLPPIDLPSSSTVNPVETSQTTVSKGKHKNFKEFFNDKDELSELKDLYSKFSITDVYTYEDEYDDTYDEVDVTLKDDEEEFENKIPRVLAAKKRKESDSESEEEHEERKDVNKDHFIQNPEEIRAKMDARRKNQSRDVVGKPKGHGQEKEVVMNRSYKNVHKSSKGNHNRRKLGDRKRNQGMFPS